MGGKSSKWIDKGDALIGKGNYNDAIKAYAKAIEIDPQDADAWLNRGAALVKLGKPEDAIKAYAKASEINPQDADAWLQQRSGSVF